MSDATRTLIPPFVQVKATWGGKWETRAFLEADQWDQALSPAMPTARLSWRYGQIQDGTGAFKTYRPLCPAALENWLVRICRPPTAEEIRAGASATEATPLWHGVIARDDESLFGSAAGSAAGDESLSAFGLELLLERAAIDCSYMYKQGGATAKIATVLPFNFISGRGGLLVGNRSMARLTNPANGLNSYVFGDAYYQGQEIWTAQEIAEYLLTWLAPPALKTILGGLSANLADLKAPLSPGPNVRATLNAMIHRGRGHSWRLTVEEAANANPTVSCAIYSAFDKAITVGGVTLQPAAVTVTLDAEHPAIEEMTVQHASEHRFDRVVVYGQPIVLMGTLSVAASTLAKAWSTAQEAAYLAATDAGRTADKFADVFTALIVPEGSLPGGPTCDDDGYLNTRETAPCFQQGKEFLRSLPVLKQAAADADPTSARKAFQEPLAVIQGAIGATTVWAAIDRPSWIGAQRISSGVSLSMMDGQLGIRVKPSMNHHLALNHWAGAVASAELPGLDYATIKLTAAWASDERFHVARDIKTAAGAELKRTLAIEVPAAQCWYRLNDTVTDVVEGELVTVAPDEILRNDRSMLAAVAAAAVAWHERPRRAVQATWRELFYDFQPGDFLQRLTRTAGDLDVNCLITRVAWNAVSGTTLVQTDFCELDFAAIAAPQRWETGGFAMTGAANSGLAGGPQVALSLPHPDNLPVRIAAASASTAGACFAVRVWQDGGSTDGDKTHKCNRTYKARTLDATGPSAGGVELGTGLTPVQARPALGKLICPSATGAGVVGLGYYDNAGAFKLWTANEIEDVAAC